MRSRIDSSKNTLPDHRLARWSRLSHILAAGLVIAALLGCSRHAKHQAPQPPERSVVANASLGDALAARLDALNSVSGPFMLSASEQELTSYVRANLVGAPIDESTMWIEPDGLYARATLTVAGRHTALVLVALTCEDGAVQLGLSSAALAGRAVPRFILASAEKALNAALSDMQTSFSIERIELQRGLALVYGEID